MGNIYQLMTVASNCSSFTSNESDFMPSIGSCMSKNCSKCTHCKNNTCELNLYDEMLSSIDDK
ncbi:hypothetical protein ACFIJ5_02540 [Haloimpatiens sp. FM7330]|uniref:hypothetical protein n=1 Tax=Haloimpatiens sp. FM7330 TaxID=3298610 RepID=UPI00362CB1DC